jgi:hypothetical protein
LSAAGHQPVALFRCSVSMRARMLLMISEFCEARVRAASRAIHAFTSNGRWSNTAFVSSLLSIRGRPLCAINLPAAGFRYFEYIPPVMRI